MDPTHKVTVIYTLTVPHELDDMEAVQEVFEDELASDSTMFVTDDDGEDQSVDVKVLVGDVKWEEL